MESFIRTNGRWILSNVIIWFLAKELFVAIKIWGIENTTVERFQFPLGPFFLTVGITGILDGFLFALYDIGIDKLLKSLLFYQRVLIKAAVNLVLGTLLSMLTIPLILHWIVGDDIILFAGTVNLAQFIILSVYFLLNTIIVQFVKLMISWMKTEDVLELIAHPHGIEEDRIFLFLDMKSSTTLAEQLQTSKYSHLLRECFNEMAEAAKETKADIYQYVGDQAVMTWKETEDNYILAVKFFFRFQEQLEQRAGEYLEKFGAAPQFKAGIHHGQVIKAQVGMMRKEIAYHGDAINTASRIQSKCSELSKNLLVSESFKEKISANLPCAWEGKFPIRGKTMAMDLYSVDGSIFSKRKQEQVNEPDPYSFELIRHQAMDMWRFVVR